MSEVENNGVVELLHTPGGVRDIYGGECARKLEVQHAVEQLMNSYGFRHVQTPTFEYFDIFSRERGTASSKEMFKFFDRGNNTLVLRPDMTPPIARCVAKYCRDEQEQLRFCYTAQTFVNTGQYKGKLQEVTQVGAELFLDDSSDADAEMVALTIECLLKSGLQEFQLEVGHADLFPALVEEAGFDVATIGQLQELIESKNFFGVEELLGKLTVEQGLKEIFIKFPELLNNLEESVAFVHERSKSSRVHKALERLQKLEQILEIYELGNYVTVDLSMISHYHYYTGVIFRAYTYGNGEAIASGGRYDSLVAQFGKEAPAIGLAIVLDQLMIALDRQKLLDMTVLGGTLLLYPKEVREIALKEAKKLREQGEVVQLMRKASKKDLDSYLDYAKRHGNDKVIYLAEDGERKQLL
ncbi:MAG: ATP phosphoribosyltransferase regulatory subunit [Lachnospiraceae bacterium]|nr:ATP phosphoribosyltransferase regulatory subunit [Lachnospiraceae bacterium]